MYSHLLLVLRPFHESNESKEEKSFLSLPPKHLSGHLDTSLSSHSGGLQANQGEVFLTGRWGKEICNSPTQSHISSQSPSGNPMYSPPLSSFTDTWDAILEWQDLFLEVGTPPYDPVPKRQVSSAPSPPPLSYKLWEILGRQPMMEVWGQDLFWTGD